MKHGQTASSNPSISSVSDEIEYKQRISHLQKKLQEQGLDGAILTFPIDIYYWTGTRQNSVLWVPVNGQPTLLVKKSFSRAKTDCPFLDVQKFLSSKEIESIIPPQLGKIGAAFDVMSIEQYNFYSKALSGRPACPMSQERESPAGRQLVNISRIIKEIRSVKSAWELKLITECGEKLCKVFREIPNFIKPGMSELDISAEIECHLRKMGNEGSIKMRSLGHEYFLGLVISATTAGQPGFFDGPVTGIGPSNCMPYGASNIMIKENSPIFIDFTASFNGYASDMTRIFVFGRISKELEKAFDVALNIQNYLAENLKPPRTPEELYIKAVEMAKNVGLEDYFMGIPDERAKFVGHGLGLEIDELPVIAKGFKEPIKIGNVLAIEPKFVFPQLGAVGIENTFAVTENGIQKITDMKDDIVYI
jgi:Xaa-Pro aminopeptidase